MIKLITTVGFGLLLCGAASSDVSVSEDVVSTGVCNREPATLRCSGKLLGYYAGGSNEKVGVDMIVEPGQCEWAFVYPRWPGVFVRGERRIYCNSL